MYITLVPECATELTDNFSAGLTLYYYQKTQSYMLNQLLFDIERWI